MTTIASVPGQIPPPRKDCPVVVFALTDSIAPEGSERMVWAVGAKNPIAAEMTVIRMFSIGGAIEVYSISEDRQTGVRDTVPAHCVRGVREVMSLDVFIDEIDAAERDDPDDPDGDPDDDLDEPELQNGSRSPITNIQPSST